MAPAVLVDAAALAAALGSDDPPVVLDVRWRLGDDSGPARHAQGHVPGAVYVDLDRELAAPPSLAAGRHPLPSLDDLQAAARRWGISRASRVVVYDDSAGLSAARAWWLLRWADVADVRLLDGGLAAWERAGLPLAAGESDSPPPGDVLLRADPDALLSADEAAQLPSHGTLLDARAAERYAGETEPIDPRAGHVPGAVSAPTTANLRADGTFLAPAELRERFAALGVAPGRGPVGVYCGSGVNAAHAIAALALAGVPARLYAGSWSQWSSDPDRPVALGPDPS